MEHACVLVHECGAYAPLFFNFSTLFVTAVFPVAVQLLSFPSDAVVLVLHFLCGTTVL
jgi:hypothetical protein